MPNINTYTNNYTYGRGRLMFNRLTNGIYEGFRPLGNCPAFGFTIESEQVEHTSSEEGQDEIDDSFTKSVKRTGTFATDNMSRENWEIALAAEATTVNQTSTSVTNEVIGPVTANRTYQLGTAFAPGGVRTVSAVTASFKEGDDAAARANTTTYEVGDFYKPATPNAHFYVCTVGGESAGSPPTFTTDGTTFADGAATFRDVGLIAISNTSDADFLVDGELGFVSTKPTGAIATAIGRLPDGTSLRLNVDYTRAALTRDQIATSSSISLSGQLKFISANSRGTNRDVFIPSCTLSPNGDIALITGDDYMSIEFNIGISKLDSVTSAIYVDGRPLAE